MLNITGTQMIDGQESVTELVTKGKYYEQGGAQIIEYEESELSGLEGSTTVISVQDDVVTLSRNGSARAHMVMKRGQKCVNLYETPFGALEMGVYPLRIDTRLGRDAGAINLAYQLDISGRFASNNTLDVVYHREP